jgi:hypothetical protein
MEMEASRPEATGKESGEPSAPPAMRISDDLPRRASPQRDDSGRFRDGGSGNPEGRPRGSRNKAKLQFEGWIDSYLPGLLAVLPQLALSNPAVMKLILDRTTPKNWRPPVKFDFGTIGSAADVDHAVSRAFAEYGVGTLDGNDLHEVLDFLTKARAALGGGPR